MNFNQTTKIKDVNYDGTMQPIITFVFNKSWLQEDIATLKQLIVEKIGKLTEVEHVIGADRETVRLAYHQQIFILNFECYSESCWLEAESESDEAGLYKLYQQITALSTNDCIF